MSMSGDSANDLFTSTNHDDDDDEFRIGKDGTANVTLKNEQFADRQQIKEFCEKFAKMEMELKEAKHLQTIAKLEFENKALQEKLKQQEMMTEIKALQAKVAKLEKEQQKVKERKYELLNAVHHEIAEKFSIPNQNCLDVNACHSDLEIFGSNCLKIYFKSNGSGFRSVFAKHPIFCSESAGIFYFEMKIINVKKFCSIGFATKAMPLDGKVGQNSDSCAYQSDGQFWANGTNNIGMPNFSRGDFVGCGINLATRRIIFTKNGHLLDTANLFVSLSSADFPLFPFISLSDFGDLIETNFGPKFKFDPAKVQKMLFNFQKNYWDANVCHVNLQIIGNKSLTVHHMGNVYGCWCSVFSKHSILLNKASSNIFYYEISVKNMKSLIIFGFAVKQQTKLKGRIRNSKYAYESNGELWINGEGKGTNAEHCYGVGDTVGIGVNSATRQIIFTKNGLRLDFSDFFVSPSFADDSFHPFVSLLFTGDKIEANFGPIFKFDFSTL